MIMKRIAGYVFFAVCSVACCADLGDVRLGEIIIPAPEGYVKINRGHPLEDLLTRLERPDRQNDVLAHYVRSSVLKPDGSLCEGEEVVQGLIMLKVPRLFKNRKIDPADFERFSGAIAAGVQRGLRSSQGRKMYEEIASAQKKAIGESGKRGNATVRAIEILDSRRLDDGSVCMGIAQVETNVTKVVTSVISCCAGHMLIIARTSTTPNSADAKSVHESSEKAVAKWLSAIRLAAGKSFSRVRHASGDLPVGVVRPSGELHSPRRQVGWQSFLKGALIGLFTLLLIAAFRRIRSNGESGDSSSSDKNITADRTSEGGVNSVPTVSDEVMADWRKVLALRPLAEGGNSKAQFELGMIYFSGKAVVDDFRVARRLFALSAEQGNGLAAGLYAATKSPCGKKLLETPPSEPEEGLVDEWRRAAEEGSPDGCFCYGLTLLRRSSHVAEISRALDCLKRAADDGFSTAQFIVGVGMLHGCGTLSRNTREGALLIGKAAKAGHDEALLLFSDFCRQGVFLPKDEKHALTYLQESADSGNATAQRLISIAYTNGDGVAKDVQKAKEYLDLSEGIHRPQVDWIKLMMKAVTDSGCDAPVRNADGSLMFNKIPSGGAMAMLQRAFEMNKPPKPKIADGELAFLNAGENGIVRLAMQKKQHKVIADLVKCRLFLPDGWNESPEIESQGASDTVAKYAGPGSHEWISVEHMFLSPEHVNDNLEDWINVSRMLIGRLGFHPHSSKESGVDACKEVAFGRFNKRDTLYMKYHQADDMASYAGTLEIDQHLHRLFIVIVRRGRDSWKFEYVFPAVGGVSRESLAFRSEELVAAARLFVPIETRGRAKCVLCGAGVDDPPTSKPIDGLEIVMKDFTLFEGGPKVSQAGMNMLCCQVCKKRLTELGIRRKELEEIPDVREQLHKGASINEVKCCGCVVNLH